jgi:hypothetical protein
MANKDFQNASYINNQKERGNLIDPEEGGKINSVSIMPHGRTGLEPNP